MKQPRLKFSRREMRQRRKEIRRQSWKWLLGLTIAAVLAVTGILTAQHASKERAATSEKVAPSRPPGPVLSKDATERTLVVYNETDPLSHDLAKFYADKRGVPHEQVVGLKCSLEEEISREEYDTTIAQPLRAIFDARNWWERDASMLGPDRTSTVRRNKIRFVALIRGMPLKIRATPSYPGDPGNSQPEPIRVQNAASVDSELAVLGSFTKTISGFIPNPYFKAYGRIVDSVFPRIMLVTRLDAPTVSMVERMITDSLAAEQSGLWGRCYLDGRGFAANAGPLVEGDDWIRKIATETTPFFLPTYYDNRAELITREFPMTDTALYFGWYAENVTGPFTRPEFQFVQGAVACHIHSFSAVSVRDPSHHWVGPLLDRGAAAVLGNVYEPYLSLTTHLDIFAARLMDGLTLAESAYAATPGLSWMNVVIGDPLYRPAKALKDLDSEVEEPSAMTLANGDADRAARITEGRAYWRGAQIWKIRGATEGGVALEKSARDLKSGYIYEGLALLRASVGDDRGAKQDLQQAGECFKNPADAARVILDEAQLMADAGEKPGALELLRKSKPRFATQIVGASLDQLETAITNTP